MEDSKAKILDEKKNSDSFVVIGQILHDMYYKDKCMGSQKEFLAWTKAQLGFSKSTTYEYIISWKIYSEIESGLLSLNSPLSPPTYQSHCQLLAKVPKELLLEAWVGVNEESFLGGAATITTSFLENFLERKGYIGKTFKEKSFKKEKSGKKKRKSLKKAKYDDSDESSDDFNEIDSNLESDLQNLGDLKEEFQDYASNFLETASIPSTPPSKNRNSGSRARSSSRIAAKSKGTESTPKNQFLGTPPPTAYSTPKASLEFPFDASFTQMIGRNVVLGQEFDINIHSVDEFKESKDWYGRVWCCIPKLKSFGPCTSQADGIEGALQTIFTKFSSKEFAEGLFLIRAEMGADWCTPVLQHPYCVLRHLKDSSSSDDYAFDTFIVFYLGPNVKEFCQIFKSIGLIPGVNSWSAILPIQVPNFNVLQEQAQFPNSTFNNLYSLDYYSDTSRLEEVVSALCDMGKGI